MLDQTPLQVTAATRLDGRIDESLPSRHAVEEELLHADARHEPAVDEAARPRREFRRGKARQRLAADRDRGPFALQLDLTEQTRDLHRVHGGSLGAGQNHQLQVVVGEFRHQTRRQTDSKEKGTRARRIFKKFSFRSININNNRLINESTQVNQLCY